MMAVALAAMMLGGMAPNGTGVRDEGDAAEMLPLLKRHEIQVLLSVDLPLSEIARRTEVSVATVKRVRDEAAVSHVDDAAERKRCHEPRRCHHSCHATDRSAHG